MTEAEIIEQLVEFQSILLLGVSLFFTIISAYMVSLYTFLAGTTFMPRLFAWLFLTLSMIFLAAFFYGSSHVQTGLVQALADLEAAGTHLSAAGQATLSNARQGLDDLIRLGVLISSVAFYVGLSVMTMWTGWRHHQHDERDAHVRKIRPARIA